jgi:hypothetical protein
MPKYDLQSLGRDMPSIYVPEIWMKTHLLLIYFDWMILIHIGPPARLLFCFSKILNLLFVDLYLFLNSLSWKICHPTHLQLECPKWAIWSSIHQLLNIIYLYRYFCVCLKMVIGVFVSTWTLYACERAPS